MQKIDFLHDIKHDEAFKLNHCCVACIVAFQLLVFSHVLSFTFSQCICNVVASYYSEMLMKLVLSLTTLSMIAMKLFLIIT